MTKKRLNNSSSSLSLIHWCWCLSVQKLRHVPVCDALICRSVRARADPRGVVSYTDLDAPPDVDWDDETRDNCYTLPDCTAVDAAEKLLCVHVTEALCNCSWLLVLCYIISNEPTLCSRIRDSWGHASVGHCASFGSSELAHMRVHELVWTGAKHLGEKLGAVAWRVLENADRFRCLVWCISPGVYLPTHFSMVVICLPSFCRKKLGVAETRFFYRPHVLLAPNHQCWSQQINYTLHIQRPFFRVSLG